MSSSSSDIIRRIKIIRLSIISKIITLGKGWEGLWIFRRFQWFESFLYLNGLFDFSDFLGFLKKAMELSFYEEV